MSEKDTPDMSECLHVSYYHPQWDEKGKCHWKGVGLQHQSLNPEAKCIVPPTKIIPVIFLPGVMGSNLKSSGGEIKAGEQIWRGDNDIEVYLDWANLKGVKRRELLNPKTTTVDNGGVINSKVYSLITDDGQGDYGTLLQPRKERGWGEILNFSYGNTLSVLQGALLDDWQKAARRRADGKTEFSDNPKENGIVRQLCNTVLGTEDENEDCLTEEEASHFLNFLYPLHVFGYNWLEDNAVSAAKLVEYIDKTLRYYQSQDGHGHGLAIEKVILVTHSMGGLVARYAMNPPDDAEFKGCQDKVLGVVHGVIPDLGSPAAYRRMKVGGKQEGLAGIVMGKSAEELMPVLARAPAPLQLLPAPNYTSNAHGMGGFSVEKGNADGSDLALPQKGDPFGEIYLNKTLWWRLYESDILDKEEAVSQNNWEEYVILMRKKVRSFISSLNVAGYHPNTYAFYGYTKPSDGSVKWHITSITYPKDMHDSDKKIPNNYREVPLPFNRSRLYELKASNSAGDGTVPVESLKTIQRQNGQLIKSVLATNVDHQGAYEVKNLDDIHQRPALQFTLRAIAKMVQEVPAC
ncbi:acetyltransferase [Providencia stuartii]|uniref:lipase family alpha/beta hydrolase n=2 Tax=Providencia TaxID=586 RepID=UPI0023E29546|nr:acetyltransferase [Providencia stuartii]ELR5144577.1 acetyltransferase [Providencia stuartii]WER23227.1 acetyltransferase [Providencia stuartii]WER27347.1 acetyltransferase [Providencia stuartii]WER31438.1 acetyltransferase [Providencia stuartii]